MGEAKRRKDRLGPWYGKPVMKGHPDFIEPKVCDPAEAPRESGEATPHTPEPETNPTQAREVPSSTAGRQVIRQRPRSIGGIATFAMLAMTMGGRPS